MQLPQKIFQISIAHDYKVIISYMAATAMLAKVRALEVLLFKWAVILYSHLVPMDFNTLFKQSPGGGADLGSMAGAHRAPLSLPFSAGKIKQKDCGLR